jgi:hypothetical protein
MSSLLERMIQRTRAPLPGVAPMVQSRYAPAAPTMPASTGSFTSPGDFTEIEDFAQASGPIVTLARGERAATSLPAALPQPTGNTLDSSAAAIVLPEENPAPAPVTEPPQRQPAGSTTPGSAASPRRPDHVQQKLPPITARNGAGAAPRLDIPSSHAIERVPASPAADLPGPGTADPLDPAAPPMAASMPADTISWEQGEPAAEALLPSLPQRHRGAPSTPVRQRTEPETTGSGPEVTISIGRIEVHTVPAVERPRRPAFRPRVTLDDFLNGRSGAPT